MPRRTPRLLLPALLCATTALGDPPPASPAAFRVVVHPDNEVEQLTREEVSRLFLKKTTRWEGGAIVLPIDLAEGSRVREGFSLDVHRRRTAAVKSFWQQMIFSGRAAPPPEVDGDSKVVAYVREHPGAIGYVSRETPIPGVREVALVDAEGGPEPQRRGERGDGGAGHGSSPPR